MAEARWRREICLSSDAAGARKTQSVHVEIPTCSSHRRLRRRGRVVWVSYRLSGFLSPRALCSRFSPRRRSPPTLRGLTDCEMINHSNGKGAGLGGMEDGRTSLWAEKRPRSELDGRLETRTHEKEESVQARLGAQRREMRETGS